MTAPTGYPVVVPRRVEWGEMDAMNHVNNVAYIRWFETGRVALFDATKIMEDGPRGIAPILKSIGCTYRAPLRYPDDILICVRVKDVAADRFTVAHAIHSAKLNRVVAEGDGIVVAYDYDRGAKTDVPQAWLDAFARIERTTQ